jgi:hypothetical protein
MRGGPDEASLSDIIAELEAKPERVNASETGVS